MINTWPGWKNVKLLGKGSFGSVYEIEKEEFGTVYKAALKVISIPSSESELNSVKALGLEGDDLKNYFYQSVMDVVKECQFLNEFKGNTNIVSIQDFKVMEKDSFGWDILIKMELLTPLNERIKKNALSQKEILKLGIDICSALEFCEKRNILHRDIKPANIFVNAMGYYKLGDFGIARIMNKENGTLSHKGTFNYMAPEIYKGGSYGKTVDIYSLGIVLYQLLNKNKLPFLPDQITASALQDSLAKRMKGSAIPMISSIDDELSKIILKAISYNPNNRYQSATEFKAALESYVHSLEEKKVVIPEKKSKPLFMIIGLVVVLVICILIGMRFIPNNEPVEIQEQEVVEIKEEANDENNFGMPATTVEELVIRETEDGTLLFGKYKDKDIEWIVLDDDGDKRFVVSKNILDKRPYENGTRGVTWESSSIREWLNNDFFNSAFNENEKQYICKTNVVNPDNAQYGTPGGNDTVDYIFLLSFDEAENYFESNLDRRAKYDSDI